MVKSERTTCNMYEASIPTKKKHSKQTDRSLICMNEIPVSGQKKEQLIGGYMGEWKGRPAWFGMVGI